METDRISDLKFFLRALVDDVLAPIFIMDENRKVIAYNNAVLSLFKITAEKLANKKLGDVFGCSPLADCDDCKTSEICIDCELNKLAEKAIDQKQVIENEIIKKTFYIADQIVKKDLRVSIKPITRQTKSYFVVVLDDVTESIAMQEKLQEQNEKMKRDLLMAKGIQNGLLPETGSIGKLQFDYLYRPCEALGGDFVDFYKIDNKYTGIIMADVAGHGLASSMFTVFLYSLIDRTVKSPAELLKKVFVEFSKFKVSSETYITMFSAVFNNKNNTLTVANAGFNNPPSISREKGIETLNCSGIPISNWVKDTEYEEITTKFKKGERLIMFSDGITETMDGNGNMLGDDLILQVLSDRTYDGAEAVRRALYEARIETKTKIKDDITISVIDYK